MKTIKFFLVFLFSTGFIYCQPENPTLYVQTGVKYFQDFLNFLDDDGQSRVDIFIQVPFAAVQFERISGGFEGGYSVTVSIYMEDEETLYLEKLWNEKIIAKSFKESSAKENFNLSYRSLKLKPGKYFIKTTVMDRDSRKEYFSNNFYNVKDFLPKPSISDIMLIAQMTNVEGKNKIVPNVSRNVSENKKEINIFFEIYSDSSTDYNIEYIITNKDNKILYERSVKQSMNEGKTQVFYTILDSTLLSLGNYILTVRLKDTNENILASTSKTFYSRWVGLPATVDNIDKAIDQLIYIANPDEIEYMENGKDEKEKTKRFIEYWKTKDPSPGNEENEVFQEYYGRVNFANEQFSHYREGWQSDRGMVFIILGPPNNVDRHPFEYDSKPYEIWQYYEINRNFTFLDETGFGDYRLITPMYGDLFRYRY
ncbi:MAG: GWxTD domain-containing protein [Bacteroidetes bacterium]|nr:GWxTD domain-containing protein [Bacteroidota bacterium]